MTLALALAERPKVIEQTHKDKWSLYCGDSCEVLRGLPDASVNLVVTSLPFSNVYSYSPSDRDLGNTVGPAQFFRHFGYITRELLRVMMSGRIVAIHCKPLPRYKTRDNENGIWDFPGAIVRHMVKRGYSYRAVIAIDKDPQRPARAYHPQKLMYLTLETDSSKSAPFEGDFLLVFMVPGENPVPIKNDLTRPEWVKFAHPVWTDIEETCVLNPAKWMKNVDERHLCPLQLDVCERAIRLWSNPNEVVMDPFNGIGSVGFVALQQSRRYIGCDLKPEYYQASVSYLPLAESLKGQRSFDDLNVAGGGRKRVKQDDLG